MAVAIELLQGGRPVRDAESDLQVVRGAAARLRARREAVGLTQGEVGEALGLSAQAIGAFERGDSQLTLTNFIGYARFVRLARAYLFAREEGDLLDTLIQLLIAETPEVHEAVLAYLRITTQRARRARPSSK